MKRVRLIGWTVLLALAALQCWLFRHSISPDGVAYLDLSDAVLRGRLGELVNGYWSPLYPFLIGVVRLVVSPTPLASPYWEFALVRVVNLIGFALSLGAFEWLLQVLDDIGTAWGGGRRPFATPLGRGVAYAVFALANLVMITMDGTVPDVFLSASLYAAFGLVLRLTNGPDDRRSAMTLGLVLAAGALTKSIMFPVGVVILATLLLAVGPRRWRTVLASSAVFIVATLPWVVAVSRSVGHASTGETGALNYAWYVNGQQPPNTGVMPAGAAPRDTLALSGLAVLPDARGTNPLWYDPTRWHRGVRPTFSAAQQWPKVRDSVRYYVYVLAPLLFALLVIAWSVSWEATRDTLRRSWPVLLPTVAAMGAYALVYTTSRYVAPFVAASCVTLAAAFPTGRTLRPAQFALATSIALLLLDALGPPMMQGRILITYGLAILVAAWLLSGRWVVAIAAAAAALWALSQLPTLIVVWIVPMVLGPIVYRALTRRVVDTDALVRVVTIGAVVAAIVPRVLVAAAAFSESLGATTAVHPEWEKSREYIRSGTPAGSKIAVVGNPENSGWARLARYQIVGVVPDDQAEAFWKLSTAERARILRAFGNAGATSLITLPPSPRLLR